jgi:hypothetical protein
VVESDRRTKFREETGEDEKLSIFKRALWFVVPTFCAAADKRKMLHIPGDKLFARRGLQQHAGPY